MPITLTGLVLALDTTREIVLNYPPKDEFFNIINQAKLRVEQAYEERLIKRGNSGDMFALRFWGGMTKKQVTRRNPLFTTKCLRLNMMKRKLILTLVRV